MREEERRERDPEAEQHPAEDKGRPEPPPREERQRQQDERRDRDRAGAPEELGLEPVAVQPEDVELIGVVRKRAPQLGVAGIVGDGVADDRQKPQAHRRRRDRHGCDRRGERAGAARVEQHPREQEAGEHDQDERRVRGVDQRHRARRGGDRGEQLPRRHAHVDEDECEQRREHQHPARVRRQRQRDEGTAVPGRETEQRPLGQQRRQAGPARAEERGAGLVGEPEAERQQHGRPVQHDLGGVDTGQLRDEREKAVPERERIARVQPAVAVLVQGAQRERAEVVELPDPAEMEERIAAIRRDPPERDPGGEPEQEHAERPRGEPWGRATRGERRGDQRDGAEHGEREPDRAVHREHQRHSDEERRQAPDENRREPFQPQRPRDDRAGNQQAGGRRGEP